MIKEDYVSFEIAKLLKEKGFDIPCRFNYRSMYPNSTKPFYHKSLKDFNGEEYKGLKSEWFSAPTLQMAMKWLREEKSIYIKIGFRFSCNADDDVNYFYDIYNHCEKYIVGKHYSDGEFVTYEEAAEAALKYTLSYNP